MVLRMISASFIALIISGCAGVRGQPDAVRSLLSEKYVGKELQQVIIDLGAPDSSFKLDNGCLVYTWRRQTDKYKSNLFIKSDERCVITMLTDKTGQRIENIGEVDDSLGAFRLSYCLEQFGL
jgi:hypothetical protein